MKALTLLNSDLISGFRNRCRPFILKCRETEVFGAISGDSPVSGAAATGDSQSVSRQPSVTMSDPCSFSAPSRCVTKHLNLSLRLDFDRHVIRGRVELTVEALEDRFSSLVSVYCC